MKFLLCLLTRWNGQTPGTRIFTARKGVKLGPSVRSAMPGPIRHP